MKRILFAWFCVFAGSMLFSQVDESAAAHYPKSVSDVPENLRYPKGAKVAVDRDGNYTVNGKIRYLLGAQPSKSHDGRDVSPTCGYPASLKWIYERTMNFDTAQRVGFDTFAPYTSLRFIGKLLPGHKAGILSQTRIDTTAEIRNCGLPLQVDFTATPYAKGMLNSDDPVWDRVRSKDANNAYHRSTINHWVPYNVFHPDARKIYRTYWEDGVDEWDGTSPVICYELFNEPGYDDPGEYNRKLFAEYLEKKYKTPETMNRVWHSKYPSFEAASKFKLKTDNAGLSVDWGKFMEEGFKDLCVFGRDVIRAKKTDALISFQPCGNLFRPLTKSHVNPYEINKHLNVLSLGTGGGVSITSVAAAPETAVGAPANTPVIGDGILHRLFFLSIGKGKPIVNGELYIGKTASSIKRTIWLDLLYGANATYCFEWTKRAWDWRPRGSAEGGKRCAEREPYHIINPYNNCEIWGIMEAKEEIFRFGKYYMPRERGVRNTAAILMSYPTERISEANGNVAKDEIRNYACALSFSHIPTGLILEEQLPEGRADDYKVIVAAGVRNIYPATAGYLLDYVKKGGTLILAREFMLEDEYGNPSPMGKILNITQKYDEKAPLQTLKLNYSQESFLQGRIKGRNSNRIISAPGWKTLGTMGKTPAVLARNFGRGTIYLVSPELQDYAAASVILPIMKKHSSVPQVMLTRAGKGDLETNVQIFPAVRGNVTLYMLVNLDLYPKLADFSIPGKKVSTYFFPLDNTKNSSGRIFLPGAGYRLIAVGDGKTIQQEFDSFKEASDMQKLYDRACTDFRKVLEEQEKGKFSYKPDLSRTRMIDIRKYCNRGYTDSVAEDGKGGWTDQGKQNSLTGVPWGEHNLLGVPCDLIRFDMNNGNTCIVMNSTSQKADLPKEIRGIPLGGKLRALYFFHTAAWVSGKVALIYRVHYASGKTLDVPAKVGVDIGNWWIGSGRMKCAFRNSEGRGFYCMEWVNPFPDEEITSLDLVSTCSRIVPIVIAITAEEYAPKEIRPFKGIKSYGWGNVRVVPDKDGSFEAVVSAKTTPYAGIAFRMSNKDDFKFTKEQIQKAVLCFEVNGGRDPYGNHKGGQSMRVSFRRRIGKKDISTGTIQMTACTDSKQIDSNPQSFQTVTVPLKEIRNFKNLDYAFDTLALQFNGQGFASGIVVKNIRLVLPKE